MDRLNLCIQGRGDRWTSLEDLALEEGCQTETYQCLVEEKGQEEVDRRKRFL